MLAEFADPAVEVLDLDRRAAEVQVLPGRRVAVERRVEDLLGFALTRSAQPGDPPVQVAAVVHHGCDAGSIEHVGRFLLDVGHEEAVLFGAEPLLDRQIRERREGVRQVHDELAPLEIHDPLSERSAHLSGNQIVDHACAQVVGSGGPAADVGPARTGMGDHAGLVDAGSDAHHDAVGAHALFAQPFLVGDAVLEAEQRHAVVQVPVLFDGLEGVLGLHGQQHHGVLIERQVVGPARSWQPETALRAPRDAQAVLLERFEVRAASDERHPATCLGQSSAQHAADRAGTMHDVVQPSTALGRIAV